MTRSLAHAITAMLVALAPYQAGAGTNDLFEISVTAEALQRNADSTLQSVPGRHARKARRLAARATSRIMTANASCPAKPQRADVKLLGAGARLTKFAATVGALPQSDAIAALEDSAHRVVHDIIELHFTGEVCDQGLTLQGGTDGDIKTISEPSDPGTEAAFGEFAFTRLTDFVNFGAAWGTQFGSAHGTLGIFGGGQASPPHTHSATYYGVVLSGVVSNPFGIEQNPVSLEPGSFWSVPAVEQHLTACVSDEPCLFYFHSRQAFDFTVLDNGLTEPRTGSAQSIPVHELTFETISPFAQFATVWGDRESGAHGTVGRFQAGAASPPHTHSVAYHGVVVSGTLVNPFAGDNDPPLLTKGSYWFVPARIPHVTACVSEEPCQFYFHAEGAFDFVPTGQ